MPEGTGPDMSMADPSLQDVPLQGGEPAGSPALAGTPAQLTAESGPVDIARFCLAEMKAEEAVEIDLRGKTSLADTMLIASGRSNRHVASIAERIISTLKERGQGAPRVEGLPAADWVLIDAGDLIVHVFRPEVRGFYNLEKMWGADRPSERAAV